LINIFYFLLRSSKPNSVKMVIYLEPNLTAGLRIKVSFNSCPRLYRGCTKQGLPYRTITYAAKSLLGPTFHSRVRDIVSVALSLLSGKTGEAVAVSHCFIIMVFGLSSPHFLAGRPYISKLCYFIAIRAKSQSK